MRADRGGEAPPTTNYVTGDSDEETWPLNNVEETISDPTLGVRADVALLEELRTITELILRNQREEKVLPPPPPVVHDCSTLRQAGLKASGVYTLFPFTFPVFCDMETDGGGWTVIQRRIPKDTHEDFNRPWTDYRQGFGELSSEFWLGLEALHQLTHSSEYELRVDMRDFEIGSKYAVYGVFRVGPESDGYRLTATHYSGNAGDALSVFHSGRKFSTFDRDQDTARNKSCAREKEGGWWFHACYAAHLNGLYPDEPERLSKGPEIRWWSNQDHVLVLNSVEMKIRRKKGFITPSGTPTDTEDTGKGAGKSEPTPDGDDKGVTPRVNSGEDQDERMDYDYHWEADNEVITFGDISGDVEDEYNVTDHKGRSDVSPWGVAKTHRNTEG